MVRNGALAATGLLTLYAVTMTVLNGWRATVEQFNALWYFMVPLAAGFGVQVGLYTRLKRGNARLAEALAKRAGVAAGGVSGGAAMLACCAHHATDVLPFLGLSAASLIIAQYQVPILIMSLAINISGILFMVFSIDKQNAAAQKLSMQNQ